MSDESTPEQRRALFRVVRGEPTAEEIAALAVTLAALAQSGDGPAGPATRDRWSDPATRMRGELRPGPGAWLASAGPR